MGAGLGGASSENDGLDEGLYEELISERIRERVDALVAGRLARTQKVDDAEHALLLGQHVGRVVTRALEHLPAADRLPAVNQILLTVAATLPADVSHDAVPLAAGPSLLLEVLGRDLGTRETVRPQLPLRRSDLLVNARGEPQLAHELAAEIHSATSIDLLVAFLKWSGLVLVRDALRHAIERGVRVRVLTTTYMGATEQRAIDELASMGVDVRVSYEVLRTRLHAKAWLFRRRRQLDTGYVGSSNLSHAALTHGLEWNVRLSRAENEVALEKFAATFETYWNGGDFEPYDPDTDGERLRSALADAGNRRNDTFAPIVIADLDVRPYPFQQEILARLDAERTVHDRWRNLVVAATGTGKTVIAAFDYKRLASVWPDRFVRARPSLLFVAHRQEILRQTQATFRQILRDPTFGELLVAGEQPQDWRYVFASVQSLSHLDLDRLPADRFDVVIVDEFHHAEAPTYRRLLSHLAPRLLVGLTATPERADGLDVRQWFDGHMAAELRLWEALERDLLCPFHYFGIYDGVDVAGLDWKRGGYDSADLEQIYTGNDARAAVVLRELADKTLDPHRVRALGFCVSVAHAEFMAGVTNNAGISAVALSGATPAAERAAALRRLRDGELQVIYSVDLFNEGLDVPEIDTVLLLRPTESATVFLQQLGRGLRHADGKSHLTVLDFVGFQRKEFRFDLRFQALTGLARSRLSKAVEDGFPYLPSGCHIQLDRVAAEVVVRNLRHQLRSDVKSLVADLIAIGDVDLATFLERSGRPLSDVYAKSRSWTAVRRAAGRELRTQGEQEAVLLKRMHQLVHVDDLERARIWGGWMRGDAPPVVSSLSVRDQRLAAMLFFVFFPNGGGFSSYDDGLAQLWHHETVRDEGASLLTLVEDRIDHVVAPLSIGGGFEDVPLSIHAHYSRDELLAGLGHATLSRLPNTDRAGVRFVANLAADVFTFTVHKSEGDYSPSTMYRDYPISPELLHWESQNATSVASPTGQRYLNHSARGSQVLVFGRLRENDEVGTSPFLFLGPATYVQHSGERPIAITWRLHSPLPLDWYHQAGVVAG